MDLRIISIVGDYVDGVGYNCELFSDVSPSILTSLGFFNTGYMFIRIMIDLDQEIIRDDEDKHGSALWIANSLVKDIVNDYD